MLRAFHHVADHPALALQRFEQETGQKAVGCFPVYTPEPIIHAAGSLPMGLWGGQVELDKVRAWLPSFACSIMQANLELELRGAYDSLAAVLIPTLCDTLKCMGQKWKGACPVIQFVHPQNRKLEAAVPYLAGEYDMIRQRLSEILKVEITDEALTESLAVYNLHNSVMREFSVIADRYRAEVLPADRHAVMKSALFMRKEDHTEKVRALIAELQKSEPQPAQRKRVVLSGILAEPDGVLHALAENGFSIAADDLAQESRQYSTDYPDGPSPLERMARQWQDHCCSLAYDEKKTRVHRLAKIVEETGADGVIVCMMKFCDPEEFDYPIIRTVLDEQKIPHLYLELEQQMTSFEQIKTRIQTFADMLNDRP
ncbi:MAG: 2-hydroxyacyl-CoA dehydratase [Clostridia bacterium]|nr:2-hydroxyacyl-CoA dehydratase [Clostridia bacterium]